MQEPAENQEEQSVHIDGQDVHVSEFVPMIDGVPYDLMNHFSVTPDEFVPRTKERLRQIYRMLEGNNFSDKFRSLIRVEQRLGCGGCEKHYEKVWNFLRIQNNTRFSGEKGMLRRKAMEASVRRD